MNGLSQPMISVVIPTYNAAAYLPGTLDSVLNQRGARFEVVVVDDGSTDGTAAILESYRDRIRAIRIENSGGPARPRNVGVAESSGAFVAFFDSDDLMHPGKLAVIPTLFAERPAAGLLCSEFQGIDADGRVIRSRWLAEYTRFRRVLVPTERPDVGFLPAVDAYRQLLRANFVGTSSVVCRREALEQAGPFDEDMKNADDVEMWFRIARAGWGFLFVDRVLHSYRKREGSVSSRGGGRFPDMMRSLERQLPFCESKDDRSAVKEQLHKMQLGYGYHLRKLGAYEESRAAYRKALAVRVDRRGLTGWLLARLGVS